MSNQTNHPVLKILINPALERFRVWIPYPLYISFVTFVYGVPINAVIIVLLDFPWFIGLLIPSIGAVAIGALTTLFAFGGLISGYRPYKTRWTIIDPNASQLLFERLLNASKDCGFEIVWHNSESGFVGVLGMELEARKAIHKGPETPVRVSFRLADSATLWQYAMLKVEVRTVVLWDTGERSRMDSLGKEIVHRAAVDNTSGIRAVA